MSSITTVSAASALWLASANASAAARTEAPSSPLHAVATAAESAIADALTEARARMGDLKLAARAAAGTRAHPAAHAATVDQAAIISALKGVAAVTVADQEWSAAKARIDS